MKIGSIPFNISLLKLKPGDLRLMKPITNLDIFEGPNSSNFHEGGLFSTEIFGRVGDDKRDETFAYIPLKTRVLHPIIFQRLGRLKSLYTEILSGQRYAVWDDKKKDFFASDIVDGQTGYQFFMSKWNELRFEPGESEIRKQRIELIYKYREQAVIDNVLVMPAGLRDAEVDNLGRTRKDEINDHYQRLIGISNTIGKTSRNDTDVLNTARWTQQIALNEIYFLIEKMLSGKKGFIQSKWGSRRIMNGTRNVITAMDLSPKNVDDPAAPGPDNTVLGLWQTSRGALPITKAALKANILAHVFGDAEGQVRLIDKKTLKSEYATISPQTYDRWTTSEGLEKVIESQSMIEARSRPVLVEDRYLALVYKPKDRKVFKVFYDIDDLPEEGDKKDVHPITLCELIYLCNYRNWNNLGVISTRYPVTGEGSTYPAFVYVRTTVKSEARVELGDDWQRMQPADENTALVYPIFEPDAYIDSAMIHSYRLGGLGGDFDGDMISNNVVYTKEGMEQIRQYLKSRRAHVDPAGGLRASAAIDTTKLVMYNITGDE